jgi:L-amino acid N-acyltransferase
VVSDAPSIMAIYNREVLSSTVTFDLVPRTLDEQRAYITSRSGGLSILVVEIDHGSGPKVIGFGSLSFYRDRPGYRTSVEDSVYVHRDHHGAGVGDLLLEGLIDRAGNNGFHAMFARVIDAADASMALHRKHGFELVGIERQVGRKFGQWRDVALLQLLLS